MNETIEDLQTRLAFQEDSINQLTLTVVRQGRELDILRKEIERLKILVQDLAPSQFDKLDVEPPPPHY